MQIITGWELYKQEKKENVLKIGCKIIDKVLGGGLRKGITEISGESGSCKTSLALQLLFQCCLKRKNGGLNSKSIYLSTEGAPPKARFNQLLSSYSSKYPSIDFGSNILMANVTQLEFQNKSLFEILPLKAKSNDVKLIIIDSIATFYKLKTNYINRAKEMNFTAQHLRKLSHRLDIIVILINQVCDVFPNDPLFILSTNGSVNSSNRNIKSTLGLSWSNNIDTRIMLTRNTIPTNNNGNGNNNNATSIIRQIHIIYSPYISKKWINFKICDDGIKGIKQSDVAKLYKHNNIVSNVSISSINTNKSNPNAIDIDMDTTEREKVFGSLNSQQIVDIFNSEEQDIKWKSNDTQIDNPLDNDNNDNNNDNDDDNDVIMNPTHITFGDVNDDDI